MYTIPGFGAMIADQVRMDAYARALQNAITPGCTVVDIGAGTGFMSLLACRFGARRVYAVDPNPAVNLIPEQARLNGFADRIVVVNDYSSNFTPDARAEVIVSDLRGILPYSEGNIDAIVDARERLLAPGGVLIPEADRIFATILSVPEEYERFTAPWEKLNRGFDLAPARAAALNAWGKHRFRREEMLVPPARVAELDYRTVARGDATLRASTEWSVGAPGTAHGIGVWFDTRLLGDVGFSNAPGEAEALYGRAFFPWEQPVELQSGDRVSVALDAWPIRGSYVWRWSASLVRDGGEAARFDQSTFKGSPIARSALDGGASSSVPVPTHSVAVDRYILEQIDGRRSLGEIAALVEERFPAAVRGADSALDLVAQCTRRYTR